MRKLQVIVFTVFIVFGGCEESDRVFDQTPWQQLAFQDTIVFSVLNSGDKLYVGTSFGVHVSTDHGHSWSISNTGLTNTSVESLASDCTGVLFASTGGGVFRSTNSGASWVTSYASGQSAGLSYLAVSPSSVIFFSRQRADSALLRSTDNGQSWTPLIWLSDGLRRISFVGDSGVFIANSQGQSYKSTNLGLTWTRIAPITEAFVSFDGTLYATSRWNGLEQSIDHGDTWFPTDCTIDSLGYLVARVGTSLLVTNYDGNVVLSTKQGWIDFSTGLWQPIWITDVIMDSNDFLYAATGAGLFYKKFKQ